MVFILEIFNADQAALWLSAGGKTRKKGFLMVKIWGSIPVVAKFLYLYFLFWRSFKTVFIMLFKNYVLEIWLLYDVIFGLNV